MKANSVGRKSFFLNYNTSTVEKRRKNMDWVNAIEKAIQYIENHLIEDITVKDVAKYVHKELYKDKNARREKYETLGWELDDTVIN